MTASAARRVRQTSQYPQNTSARKQKNSGEESNIEERFQYSDAGRAGSGRLFTPQPSAVPGVSTSPARESRLKMPAPIWLRRLHCFLKRLTLRRLIGGFSLTCL